MIKNKRVIKEGKVRKGGRNTRPTSQRPEVKPRPLSSKSGNDNSSSKQKK